MKTPLIAHMMVMLQLHSSILMKLADAARRFSVGRGGAPVVACPPCESPIP